MIITNNVTNTKQNTSKNDQRFKVASKNRNCIGIIVLPYEKASQVPLSNLIDVIGEKFQPVFIITGGDENIKLKRPSKKVAVEWHHTKHRSGSNSLFRIMNYVNTQVKLCLLLMKLANGPKHWLFFLGGENLILPMFVAKLFGKKVTLILGGSSAKIAEASKDTSAIALSYVFRGTRFLANRIIVYSPNIIKMWNLENYKNKILIAHRHFLDFEKFKITKDFCDRGNVIGYIGRLSEEKGVMEFVRAILLILKKGSDLNFIIGGDGPLQDEIEEFVTKTNLSSRVKLAGWITHNKLPDYLNELKLLILPSYTEGLPNIMVEGMACGTPVLATPVGAIPDIIKDGETGFIMEDNSPECIEKNIIRAINYPDLERIAENGRKLVEKEFTFEKAVEMWGKILEQEI